MTLGGSVSKPAFDVYDAEVVEKLVHGDMRRIPAKGALVSFLYGSDGRMGEG
jgi:hypothetical protein